MRAALRRRLIALEGKLKPESAVGNLDAEIQVMTSSERKALREYLLSIKNGDQQCDSKFDKLKLDAEAAVYSARTRLGL